ncbi:MAG: hypothetical protein WDN48_16695 [Pseudolabrys sp.]
MAALSGGLAAYCTRRAGQNDAEELARNAAKIELKQWPGTLIAYFLGQTKIDAIAPPSSHGAMGRSGNAIYRSFPASKP